MGFQIDKFITLRPFLYHLTTAKNLAQLRVGRSIVPAGELMKRAGRIDLLRVRRKEHEVIEVDGQRISLRDQKPNGTTSNVVEVTFAGEIALPKDVEYGVHPNGPWKRLN